MTLYQSRENGSLIFTTTDCQPPIPIIFILFPNSNLHLVYFKKKKRKKNCAPCDKSESELLQILYIAKFAEHFSQVCWCLLCRTLLLLLFFLVIHMYKITGYIMKAC